MARVNQQRMIEVQLSKADQLSAASEHVGRFLDDPSVVTESATELMLRFRTSRPEDDLGDLLKNLISNGIRVTQFREVPTDLEDAFLSVTGGGNESVSVEPGEVAAASRETNSSVTAGETS